MRTTSAVTVGAAALLLAVMVVAGCASTDITERQRYQGAQLARPDRIMVHDFTADPAEVPPESPFAAKLAGAVPPTPEQRELGRESRRADPRGPGGGSPEHGAACRAGCGPSGEVSSEGGGSPGFAVPLAVLAATANPIGLVVGGGAKLYGEGSDSETIEGAAKRTADEIAAQIRTAAEEQRLI